MGNGNNKPKASYVKEQWKVFMLTESTMKELEILLGQGWKIKSTVVASDIVYIIMKLDIKSIEPEDEDD